MANLKILIKGNKILEKKSSPIKKENISQYKNFAENLKQTMIKHNGIGLAAPQVGKSIRMICIHQDALGKTDHLILVNPKITFQSKKLFELEEGCLSIPGVMGLVQRPEKIRVKYLDLQGQKATLKAKNLLASILQHEIDHLDGILFTEKAYKITKNEKKIKL